MPGVQETVLQAVQSSCAELVAASPSVLEIDAAGVAAAAASLPAAQVHAAAARIRLPIRFDSLQEELDYFATSSLLDFGSGFDPLLRAKGQPDAFDAVDFGMLGAAMQDTPLDAKGMAGMTKWQVSSLLGVDASEEREVMPGITMTSPGPLSELIALMTAALNDTGRLLVEQGYGSLGAFVLALIEGRQAAGRPPSAATLVEDLAETFLAFDDVQREGAAAGTVFHRKAQGLVCRLYLRFSAEDDRFAFADVDCLTADSGDVLPAVLAQTYPVLNLSPELAAALDEQTDLAGDERAAVLRAAAVDAVHRICQAAGGAYQPYQLSAYLVRRARADESGWRALRRPVVRGTLAY